MAEKDTAETMKLSGKQRELMSQRLGKIAELESARAKVAELNKKLFDAGFPVEVLCW